MPSKDCKAFTVQLKKTYGAAGLKAVEAELKRFKQAWSQYPGAVDICATGHMWNSCIITGVQYER